MRRSVCFVLLSFLSPVVIVSSSPPSISWAAGVDSKSSSAQSEQPRSPKSGRHRDRSGIDTFEVSRSVTVTFPGDASIGRLLVIAPDAADQAQKAIQVAGAKGVETVKVPPGYVLALEPNRRVFENPECLDKVSPQGIECIKTSFTSLDDREDGMCDRALGYVSHLTSVKWMVLSRSDVTDVGLSKLKNNLGLEAVECAGSPVQGACLEVLSSLPKIRLLNLGGCSLNAKNIFWLAHFKNLEVLNLNRNQLNEDGLKVIAKCKNLTRLNVASNSKVDDTFIKSLVGLKNLYALDLRDTRVTANGLAVLKGLKLENIYLTDRGYSERDTIFLQKIFPGVKVEYLKAILNDDMKTLLAPITR